MKILVTAGPTREPLDPVRFLSNRSTGKMGYAMAMTGMARGHDVVLISGPVHLPLPQGVHLIRVTTAQEMLGSVVENVEWCDVLIMAAAVADWRPTSVSRHKLKKSEMLPELALERTPDILRALADHKGKRVYIGFAAETENIVVDARRKLEEKGLDLIVINDITRPDSGFEVETNKVTLLTKEGMIDDMPVMKKRNVADKILEWVEGEWEKRVEKEESV